MLVPATGFRLRTLQSKRRDMEGWETPVIFKLMHEDIITVRFSNANHIGWGLVGGPLKVTGPCIPTVKPSISSVPFCCERPITAGENTDAAVSPVGAPVDELTADEPLVVATPENDRQGSVSVDNDSDNDEDDNDEEDDEEDSDDSQPPAKRKLSQKRRR
ncbi:hypothetical protein CSUB01_04721 [Colletotrichum sublineola]|uniref:Uncharacterized protein n=1 Tax=Colletotrichum sublineola TaxID=1173701 RepID=A0A066XJM6_COLSU|nr:hypothetical protein CSUB01_04721 [Colletotrichum sublineola]